MLVSYIKSKQDLATHFEFTKTCVFREHVDDYVKQCSDSDILLCSCYVWNWEITNYLARQVKDLNPNCLVIFGGPHVPEHATGFFDEHPYVDILAHGEGEYILEHVLRAYITDHDYAQIKGITTRDFTTPSQERIHDLDSIPSPYLTNLVWDLVDQRPGVTWICSWETNRGCPYMCTFCDWGSATFTKLRKFSDDRLVNEIEWFGQNRIPFVDCCDANFGIYPERDLFLARRMKEMALATGYLQKMAVSWAKNTSAKIIPIARELRDGRILGAVTLAVQSLDENVLKIIKRANIKFRTFSELAATFRENAIPTYSELIRGLPGETVETFKDGLEVLASTKIGTVNIYHCMILPNAPMNDAAYLEKFAIKKTRSPVMLQHSSIAKRGTPEYEYIVVETSSYTLDQLKEMYAYSWAFSTLQKFGVLEHISTYYNRVNDLRYMQFFELFFRFCQDNPESIFAVELEKVRKYSDEGYAGNGWDHYDPQLGEIVWPMEEASWLRLTWNKAGLIEDLTRLVTFVESTMNYKTDDGIIRDLIKFQIFVQNTREDKKVETKVAEFEYDWQKFFAENERLAPGKNTLYYRNPVLEDDPIKWSYKVAWYGRRSEKYKCHPEHLKAGRSSAAPFSSSSSMTSTSAEAS